MAILIARHLGKEPEVPVTPGTRLREELGIDSLDLVDLVVAAEDQFGVLIPDEAAERFETVGDVAGFLERAGPAPAGAAPAATAG